MTAPAKHTPAKAAAPKADDNKVDTVKPSESVTTSTDVKPEKNTSRIPEALSKNTILKDFAEQYFGAVTEIESYNKAVLAEKTSEWNAPKVMEKARSLVNPTEPGAKPNAEIKTALSTYDRLVNELADARKKVLEVTSAELGITLSSVAQRDSEQEAPLREKRKLANEIGQQLTAISKLTSDVSASEAVTKFLADNPLPAVGRDQVKSFSNDGKTTPKYRVKVTVRKDGNVVLEEDGFTKTALALTKPVYGYDRGKALKSDDLRAAWEKPGNTPENTVQPVVEFEDNGLNYTITKK